MCNDQDGSSVPVSFLYLTNKWNRLSHKLDVNYQLAITQPNRGYCDMMHEAHGSASADVHIWHLGTLSREKHICKLYKATLRGLVRNNFVSSNLPEILEIKLLETLLFRKKHRQLQTVIFNNFHPWLNSETVLGLTEALMLLKLRDKRCRIVNSAVVCLPMFWRKMR